MGAAFYPVFEDGGGGWTDDINGKCLARADFLDKVAKSARVPMLRDYYSMTRHQMIAELLDGDPDDPATYDEARIPKEHWFEAPEGLRTVRALLDYVRSNGATINDVASIREDLEAFERHLASAAERRVRWHLAIES